MRKFAVLKIALVIAGAFLFLAGPARAQSFTSVTGTVVDPNGIPYGNGTMSAVLTPGSPGGWTLNGQPYGGRVGPLTLDSNGSFTANFGSNAVILPAGTHWLITVNSNQGGVLPPLGTGAQTFSVTMTISGASQNISATLDAAAPKLTNITAGGSGTITGCTTRNGVPWENGTDNTLTCGPNLEWFDSGTYGVLVGTGLIQLDTTSASLSGGFSGLGTAAMLNVNDETLTGFYEIDSDNEVTSTSPTVDSGSPYVGVRGQGDAEGTGTIAEVIGVIGKGSAGAGSNVGTCTLCIGVDGENNIPANATTTYALRAQAPTTEGTGTIGAAEGLHIENMMTNTPRPSASIGLHIDAQTNGGTAIQVDGGTSTFQSVSATTYGTATNCSSAASPAVCAAAAAGSVVVAAAATSVVVDTSAVTANSQIFIQFDSSLGTKLSVTCNATVDLGQVTARSTGVSFTITSAAAPAVNPACYSYFIVN